MKYRSVKDVFAKVALRRWKEHPKFYLNSVMREDLIHDYQIREEARARWLRMVLVDMVYGRCPKRCTTCGPEDARKCVRISKTLLASAGHE